MTELDLEKLVSAVKGRYSAKQTALKNDVTLGDQLILSSNDEDYVLGDGVKFWQPLTGIRGVPYGRIVQIAGKSDSGKSTTAMLFMKAAQDSGALVVLWDTEKKFAAKRFADHIGGDPKKLAISRNKNIIEGAKQVAFIIQEAKKMDPDLKILLVWDSVGSTLNSSEEDDDEDYSKQPGVTAKEVTWAIKKFNKLIERYRNPETGKETIACLCVNQIYANIGSSGYTEKGGQELYYLSSLILQMSRKGDLQHQRKGLKYKYGITSRAKVKKNHLFDGTDCISEMDLVVSADGIYTKEEMSGKDVKVVEEDG